MNSFLFKDRDGQTPLPQELQKGLKLKMVQTMGELDEYEEQNIAEGLAWLDRVEADCLDYGLWLKLHRKLFGDVWSWAGKIRDHDLNNPDFLQPLLIRVEMKKLIDNARFWFEKHTYPEKETLARIHERVLTIHPFANGNGRWSRILSEYICKRKKLEPPLWNLKLKNNPENRRRKYIEAVEEARQNKNYSTLADIIFS